MDRFLVRRFAFCFFLIISNGILVTAQDTSKNTFGKGLKLITIDSSFSMRFSARFQSLYSGTLNLENDHYEDGFQIRRARLKFDGFAYSPKLEYKIELALSNSDITSGGVPQSGRTASIVLDAVVKWKFAPNFSLWFGQTKLPGNRERVVSSQALQFVDRSLVNSVFNIDRDAGVQLHYSKNKVKLVGALSMGEGRNITRRNAGGYDYTLRAEYLPFGKFTSKGDYFEADLAREQTPKLAIGATFDYNDRTTRERGQLGDFLTEQRDLSTWFIDAHFKYNGFSTLIEYAHKTAPDDPVILDENDQFVSAFYTGEGLSAQAGYLFSNNVEIAGRYTAVNPENVTLNPMTKQYTLGVSKYIVGHSLKVQSDVTFIEEEGADDNVMYRLQVELGF